MTSQQKSQIKANLHTGAARVASTANAKAKTATGWRKWVYAALAILAGAVAFFTATACTASYSQTASGDIAATVTIVQPVEVDKK
jgi:uncharacterized membrane protein HdeD (DUF308 family)